MSERYGNQAVAYKFDLRGVAGGGGVKLQDSVAVRTPLLALYKKIQILIRLPD